MEQVSETPETPAPNPPPPSETAHLLSDIQKLKARERELQDKLKTKEEEDLKKSQQWQQLAEIRERENQELKEQLTSRDKAIISDKKYSAIKDAALKAGIRKEALVDLELIDLDGVQVETTSTGRVNVLGADDAVSRLKTLRPHWFGGSAPSINTSQPEVIPGGKLTTADLKKMETEARSTGDYTKYTQAVLQFKKQG